MLQETVVSERPRGPARPLGRDVLAYATLLLDSSWRIASCSAAITSMFGHATSTLLGRHVSTLMPDLAELDGAKTRSPEPHASVRLSKVALDAVHADGSMFPVEISLLRDGDSGPCGWLLFIRNLASPMPAG
jgi:PAS domain S-box-containing protein